MRAVNTLRARPQRRGLPSIAILIAAVGLLLSPNHAYAANIDIWMSTDDRFDLYTGTGGGTSSFVGGQFDWTTPGHYSFALPNCNYLYTVGADVFGLVWGLGGYLSLDGGANYNPILPGSGWEVAFIGNSVPWPNQSTVDSWIVTANSNNDWVPIVPGSAFPGFGMPTNYGSVTRPALASVWHPSALSQAFSTVLFRYHVVPEPASEVVLMIGLGIVALWRRNTKVSGLIR
jgi:hypothetical protein